MGTAPRTVQVESTRAQTQRLSLWPCKWFAIFTISACGLIWLARGVYIYWDDARIINFMAAWIPSIVFGFLAFIPVHQMEGIKKFAWRSAIFAVGLAWSIVLWRQQVVTDKVLLETQKNLVNQAVALSNQHSDEHSDKQIEQVRKDVHGVQGDLEQKIGQSISQSTSSLSESIGKVGKPNPPVPAVLTFSLWEPKASAEHPVLTEVVSPNKDGNYPVELSVVNGSESTAEEIDLWIDICDACSYSKEPEGFENTNGSDPHVRHRMFSSLNPGANIPKMTIEVKAPDVGSSFQVGVRYTCKTCGGKTHARQLATIIKGSMPQ